MINPTWLSMEEFKSSAPCNYKGINGREWCPSVVCSKLDRFLGIPIDFVIMIIAKCC